MANQFLEDNYRPVSRECTVTELSVTGRIPEHLDGRYLRNGPNPITELDPDAYHWFMGDGMVHGVRIRDGRAEWYRNRWVRNPRVAARLGEPPRTVRHRAGGDSVSANTNVLVHAGRTLALIEGGMASFELTDELDTVGACDFDGTLTGGYTAHPKRDPLTGELHAVSYSFNRGNTVQYSVIGVDGRARRTVDVEVTGSPMMHDFSLTERYVVFYDLPVTFDPVQAARSSMPAPMRLPARLVLSALVGRVRIPDPITAMMNRRIPPNSPMPYRWNPRYPARIGILPREGGAGDVRWFDVAPCYVFHAANAYDDGDRVVLDVVRHPTMFATNFNGPREDDSALYRWTVDLRTGAVREDGLDDRPQEFPRVDERLVGRRHRYGYTVGALEEGWTAPDAVLRHDLTAGTTSVRSFGAGRQAGEFVFVPNAADSPEDAGTLMGFVYDPATGRSDLVLLDAATLETVAAIHLPVRVPHGFHGNWAPEVPDPV